MLAPRLKAKSVWLVTKAAGRVISSFLANRPYLVSEEDRKNRLAACKACEHYLPETKQCGVCTCLVSLKSRLATETCPHEHWT